MTNNKQSSVDLSIIIPVYNSSRYLRACLDSIVRQDSERYEIICIDDGSEDNSLDILLEYIDLLCNYRIIKQEHRGLSVARNKGIIEAIGEYVFFVDSDDIVSDDFIEYAINTAKYENLDVLMFSFENFAEDVDVYKKYENRILKKKRTRIPESNLSGTEMLKYHLEIDEYYPMVWIQLTKRKVLIDNNLMFYEGIFFEDMLYTLSLLWHAKKVKSVMDIGYKKRIHEESICGRPENIHNVDSLWKNYKELIVLCEQYDQENENYEYIVKTMINKSVKQLLLHYERLNIEDKAIFMNGLSRWDKVRFDFLLP